MKKCKWIFYILFIAIAVSLVSQQIAIERISLETFKNSTHIDILYSHSRTSSEMSIQLARACRQLDKKLKESKIIDFEPIKFMIENKIFPTLHMLIKTTSFLMKNQKEIVTYVSRNVDPKPSFLNLRLATTEVVVGRAGGTGTIIKIDEEYLYILTARHIVDCKGEVIIQVTDIEVGGYIKIENIDRKNIYKDKKLDMALIKAPRPKGKFVSLTLAKNRPTIGTKIYIIGHPINLSYTINSGIVSNYTKRIFGNNRQEYMMISASAFNGNSGGTCINSFNKIVGIVVGIAYIPEKGLFNDNNFYLTHLVFVVPIDKINKFMEELEIEMSNSN